MENEPNFFFGKLKTPKRHYEINGPLALTYFEIISFPIPSEIGIGPTSHSDSGSVIP